MKIYAMASNKDYFDQFLGTDIWVKAVYQDDPDFIYYIKLHDDLNAGGVLSYNAIYAGALDDPDYLRHQNWSQAIGMPSTVLPHFNRTYLTYWKVIEPVEIITDEEVDEILARLDDQYAEEFL